ncbi:DUF6415 family natural product biosynthesis protein [Streptomyces sp. NPDC058374]|uniref:DUF6415 family natural product biosynthesis protein n=1 Tax=Streptomyces sp. NPDC058374 TaxID=3346466 RepID=UPI003646BA11
MTTVVHETASRLHGSYAEDDATTSRVWLGLRRFLASDAVTEELYEDLETVLGEDAARPEPADCAAITDRLRSATAELVNVVPRLITPYSEVDAKAVADQMPIAVLLSAERPTAGAEYGHLVRFANAILTLLDLMGEAAEA